MSGARRPAAVRYVNPAPAARSGGAIWHRLSLRNGWVPAPQKDGYAGPSWAVIRGVVYLRGAVRKARARSLEFAVLPEAARPARTFAIDAVNPRVHLVIRADGEMTAHVPDKSQVLAVITAISYPQAGGSVARDLHRLSLLRAWAASDARVAGKPSYALSRAIVYLSGMLRFNPGGQTRSFARLPRAARPRHVMYLAAFGGILKHIVFIGTITIHPDGRMFAMSPIPSSIWLTGIFPRRQRSGHSPLPLRGGPWRPPSYAIVSGVVYLAGAAVPPSGCVCPMAVLPAAAAPRYVLVRNTVAGPDFSIVTGGVILSTATSIGDASEFTSLAGTSYPQRS